MFNNEIEGIEKIAVIGLSGRFPGAKNVDEFWDNLCKGKESISFFDFDKNAIPAGTKWVGANGLLDNVEYFDADYFGFSRREAEATDPQHRILLECCDDALNDAGYISDQFQGKIGVFVGAGSSSYFHNNVKDHPDVLDALGNLQAAICSEKSFVATKVSHKLGLTGPSMTVDTACSTSLVAIHQACASLLAYESDMVLAGGAGIDAPQAVGHPFSEGGIASPDGHCRAFDAKAKGTVRGYGAGIVVLKRLDDAIEDGDNIYAVILASAVNNDGNLKPGFTAPSVAGQSEVIAATHALAGVNASDIGYIESHGTGTELGDQVEIQALCQAFAQSTDKQQFCGVGALKPNIGHLDIAAGVAGFIKTVLILKHQKIPPTINFDEPNPKINFPQTPFFIVDKLKDWPQSEKTNKAGVSSFGIGGTNVHVLLESPPATESKTASKNNQEQAQLLIFSAKSTSALKDSLHAHADYIAGHSDISLESIAYTLRSGRRSFSKRAVIWAQNSVDAVLQLTANHVPIQGSAPAIKPKVTFMFAGQGVQKVNMWKAFYEHYPRFKQALDSCASHIKNHAGWHLLDILYPQNESEESEALLNNTEYTQPVLFSVEYACAQLLISWGIQPDLMIGHSLGEYVAATLAEVFSLEDGIKLVVGRAKLMSCLPAGDMLAVAQAESDIRPYLSDKISLAAVNTPTACVLAGDSENISELKNTLMQAAINCQILNTSHAFHSCMMDPILEEFKRLLVSVSFRAPKYQYISNVSGRLIQADEATNPEYWVKHLRGTVRFADGLATLASQPNMLCLEVSPGNTLTAMAMRNDLPDELKLLALSDKRLNLQEQDQLRVRIGQFWCLGGEVAWGRAIPSDANRVSIPGYPYQRERFWLDAKSAPFIRFHEKEQVPVRPLGWIAKKQDQTGKKVIDELLLINATAEMFETFIAAYDKTVIRALNFDVKKFDASTVTQIPSRVIWFAGSCASSEESEQELLSIFHFIKTYNKNSNFAQLRFLICTPEKMPRASKAMMSSVALVASAEFPSIEASSLAFDIPEGNDKENIRERASLLMDELSVTQHDPVVRISDMGRQIRGFVAPTEKQPFALHKGKTYLITGGCGGLGQQLAKYLATHYQAHLIIVGRSEKSKVDGVLTDIANAGASIVEYYRVDIADAEAVNALAESIAPHGIIHCAGTNKDCSWMLKDAVQISEVLASKVRGIRNLENSFDFCALDLVVLCSSIGTLTGVPFQLDYLAGNAFIDGLAEDYEGRASVCAINWGVWSESPLSQKQTDSSGEEVKHNISLGLSNLQALACFERALASGYCNVSVVKEEQLEYLKTLTRSNNQPKEVKKAVDFSYGDLIKLIHNIWVQLLGDEALSNSENFFELGGDSLLIVQLGKMIEQKVQLKLTPVELFNAPTVEKLSDYIYQNYIQPASDNNEQISTVEKHEASRDIAIIGMSLRVPGAQSLEDFWENLRDGKDTIITLTEEQLRERKVSEKLLASSDYVKAGYALADIDKFDADFFGMTPKEASLTDPQQRLLLECSHEALLAAGYEDQNCGNKVGIYAGTAMSSYLLTQILPSADISEFSMVDSLSLQTGNTQDYAATQIAYRLGLNGPAVNVNSACSTSLVAVHTACNSLAMGDCDIAIAGGASIRIPQCKGYLYAEGSVESKTGKCRPFDERADGTIMSSGAAVVVLKLLKKAQQDKDHIYAVIKGSSVNNDGNHKVSFAAPSMDGQVDVIRRALDNAGIKPESIGYIEAHGTGTKMGDPLEFEALRKALRENGGPCYIGSVKSNIGHVDSAAGVVGLIKAALMLSRRTLLPTANFDHPNKQLQLDKSRFKVSDRLMPWESYKGEALRAGVSSFGIGGSNAHVVMEQAPETTQVIVEKTGHLFLLSAHSKESLQGLKESVRAYVDTHPKVDLAALAHTLATRRKHRVYRDYFYVSERAQITEYLNAPSLKNPVVGKLRDSTMLLGMWQALPLTWVYELSCEITAFKNYYCAFAAACGDEQQVLAYQHSPKYQEAGDSLSLAGMGLVYAIAKTLAQVMDVKFKATDKAGQYLCSMLSDENAIRRNVQQYCQSCIEGTANDIELGAVDEYSRLISYRNQDRSYRALIVKVNTTASEALSLLLGELWYEGIVVNWKQWFVGKPQNNILIGPYPYIKSAFWHGDKSPASIANTVAKSEQNHVPATLAKKSRPTALVDVYIKPNEGIETEVVNLWEDIIGVAPIGIDDDFFALGGHSLMATEMIKRIRDEFNIALDIATLFELQSPQMMAKYIIQQQMADIDIDMLEAMMNEVVVDIEQ